MNLKVNISINSGAALVLFLISLAALLVGVAFSAAIAGIFFEAAGILTVAFGGYLKKRDSNNQIALKAEIESMRIDPGRGATNG